MRWWHEISSLIPAWIRISIPVTFLFWVVQKPISFFRRPNVLHGNWIIKHLSRPCDGKDLQINWVTEANLKHVGRKICGSAISICNSPPDNPKDPEIGDKIEYKVEGEYYDGICHVAFLNKNHRPRSRSVFLLELTNTGSILMGYRSFVARKTDENQPYVIRSVSCQWERKRSDSYFDDSCCSN